MTTPSPRPLASAAREQRDAERRHRSERTDDLLRRAQTCEPDERDEVLDEVIVLNRGVAEAIAARYRGRGVSDDDLEQAAYEGLIKAVRRFDPSVRPDLLTYAVPTIRGEVQRWFRDQSWMVRPPRRIQVMQWQVSRSAERLSQQLGREPTRVEISEDLDCEAAEVEEAMEGFGAFRPPSLDQPVGADGGATLGDLIVAPDDHDVEAVEARIALAPVVRRLSERERRIVYLRFFEGWSQRDIGGELGVTQMQVSRLIQNILTKLRRDLDDRPALGA